MANRKPEGKVAYFHFLNVMTLGVIKNEDGSFKAAASICSGKDNFNRRLGRLIVDGRLTIPEKKLNERERSWPDGVFHANDIDHLIDKTLDLADLIGSYRFDRKLDGKNFEESVRSQITSVIPRVLKTEIQEEEK